LLRPRDRQADTFGVVRCETVLISIQTKQPYSLLQIRIVDTVPPAIEFLRFTESPRLYCSSVRLSIL
jgi:hypothetical protein